MADRQLRIARGLALPLDAVTETFAILAKRGVGKTYTGAVLAEEMVGAGAQVVILDPLDAWWGLRSSADGSGDGLPIYVFGGEHGDLALEATAGELLADVVVDHGISAIFSLRHLAKNKQRQFVTAFAERLYHRKGEPEHRTPLHVFIDEHDGPCAARPVVHPGARRWGPDGEWMNPPAADDYQARCWNLLLDNVTGMGTQCVLFNGHLGDHLYGDEAQPAGDERPRIDPSRLAVALRTVMAEPTTGDAIFAVGRGKWDEFAERVAREYRAWRPVAPSGVGGTSVQVRSEVGGTDG